MTNFGNHFFDGVTIDIVKSRVTEPKSMDDFDSIANALYRSTKAADALKRYLQRHRWRGVRLSYPEPDDPMFTQYSDFPAGGIRVSVGFKPEQHTAKEEEFWHDPFASAPDGPLPAEREEPRQFTEEQQLRAMSMLNEQMKLPHWVTKQVLLPIEVRCPANNAEAKSFASEIATFLQNCGLNVTGGGPIIDGEFPRRLTGLFLYTEADEGFHGLAILQDVFKSAGIEYRHAYKMYSGPADAPLQIFVGW